MMGYARMLELEGELNAVQKEDVHIIVNSGDQLLTLCGELIKEAKAEVSLGDWVA